MNEIVTAKPQYPCHEDVLRVRVPKTVLFDGPAPLGTGVQIEKVWAAPGSGRILVQIWSKWDNGHGKPSGRSYLLFHPCEGLDPIPHTIRDEVATFWESLGLTQHEEL